MHTKKYLLITIILPLFISNMAISTITSETNDISINNLAFNSNLLATGTFGKDFTLEDILTDNQIAFSDFTR